MEGNEEVGRQNRTEECKKDSSSQAEKGLTGNEVTRKERDAMEDTDTGKMIEPKESEEKSEKIEKGEGEKHQEAEEMEVRKEEKKTDGEEGEGREENAVETQKNSNYEKERISPEHNWETNEEGNGRNKAKENGRGYHESKEQHNYEDKEENLENYWKQEEESQQALEDTDRAEAKGKEVGGEAHVKPAETQEARVGQPKQETMEREGGEVKEEMEREKTEKDGEHQPALSHSHDHASQANYPFHLNVIFIFSYLSLISSDTTLP